MQLPPISHAAMQASQDAQKGETPGVDSAAENGAAKSRPHAIYLNKPSAGKRAAPFSVGVPGTKTGHAAGGVATLPSLDAIPHARLFRTDEQRSIYAKALAELDNIQESCHGKSLALKEWMHAYAMLEKLDGLHGELTAALMPAPEDAPDPEMQLSLQKAVDRSNEVFRAVQDNRARNAGLRQPLAAK